MKSQPLVRRAKRAAHLVHIHSQLSGAERSGGNWAPTGHGGFREWRRAPCGSRAARCGTPGRQALGRAKEPAAGHPRRGCAGRSSLRPSLLTLTRSASSTTRPGVLSFYNKYGVLHELLAYPIPASGERYADVLRGHLRAERIGSMSLRRLATAHPQTVDAVSRKILGQPRFAWAEHGEALLRRRKSWYFGRDPVPASPCPVAASVSSSGRQTGKDRPDGVLSWEIMTSCGIPRPRMGPVRARH
jgi:hypothetical protein